MSLLPLCFGTSMERIACHSASPASHVNQMVLPLTRSSSHVNQMAFPLTRYTDRVTISRDYAGDVLPFTNTFTS